MGRPSLGRSVVFRAYLTPAMLAWLDAEAARLDVTRNEALCGLIDEAMMREQVSAPAGADEDQAEARAVEGR